MDIWKTTSQNEYMFQVRFIQLDESHKHKDLLVGDSLEESFEHH